MKGLIIALMGMALIWFLVYLSMPSRLDGDLQIIAAYADKADKCGYDSAPILNMGVERLASLDIGSLREAGETFGRQIRLYELRNLQYTSLECSKLPREIQQLQETIHTQ